MIKRERDSVKNKKIYIALLSVVIIVILEWILQHKKPPYFKPESITTMKIRSLSHPSKAREITGATNIETILNLLNQSIEKPVHINNAKGWQMTLILNNRTEVEFNSGKVKIKGVWYKAYEGAFQSIQEAIADLE